MERWVGKVAIVTGASSGIGSAIAIKLVKAGVKVVGIARRVEPIQKLACDLRQERGRLYAFKVDITKEDEVIESFSLISKSIGPIHILINNAGCISNATLLDGDTDTWKQTIDTNMLGLCITTREAIGDMRRNNVDGHVVHLSSVLGHVVPTAISFNVYSATKFGVRALNETLRHELIVIGSKIKMTSISPGAVRTELLDNLFEGVELKAPVMEKEDVADAVMYALGTPPHVQVQDLLISPLGEVV